MDTPSQPESHQVVALGWLAYDLTAHDVAPLLDRFISRFEPGAPDECWLWQGGRFANGYGRISRSSYHTWGQHLLAHRVSWVAFTGQSIVNRLTIDHLCNTRLCVNPDHLEPVSLHENIRRKNERRGYVIGAKSGANGNLRKRRPARPFADDEDRKERARVAALAYYHANREQVLAKRRASPRSTTQATCESCGLELRRDGLRRHAKRTHGAG